MQLGQAFLVILSYLPPSEAIQLQALNTKCYFKLMPHLTQKFARLRLSLVPGPQTQAIVYPPVIDQSRQNSLVQIMWHDPEFIFTFSFQEPLIKTRTPLNQFITYAIPQLRLSSVILWLHIETHLLRRIEFVYADSTVVEIGPCRQFMARHSKYEKHVILLRKD